MESQPRKKVSGGRPTREEARLLSVRIVDEATRLMLEHGYSGASIEAIASAAGVAKRTLYHRFPDKRDLFTAVIQRRRDQFLAPVAKIAAAGGNLEDRLNQIGRHMLDWALKADTIALRRLLSAEAERFPELLDTMHRDSRLRTLATLAAIFERETALGTLAVDDPEFAAHHFLQMVLAPAELLAGLGVQPPCSSEDQCRYIAKTVNLFLNGCRPRP